MSSAAKSTVPRARLGWWIVGGAFATAALALAYPAYTDVQTPPLALVLAMRRPLLLAAVIAAAASICIALVRSRRRRKLRLVAGVLVVAVAATAVVSAIVPSTAVAATHASSRSPGAITLLSWNTNQQDVSPTSIDALIESTKPDVVVLPEYFGPLMKGLRATQSGNYQLLSWDASASSVLISRTLGTYRLDTQGVPAWAGFVVRPTSSSSPTLVIAHLQRSSITDGALWRTHLTWAASACNSPDSIAIGDFNAAPENLPAGRFGHCQDAARLLKVSDSGTWPTALPAALGTQIDHAFLGDHWSPTRFHIITTEDNAGSDHRPILVTVQPR